MTKAPTSVNDPRPTWMRVSRVVIAAVVGDALILLSFAAIGRSNHGDQEGGAVVGVLGTAMPFLLGWFLAATVMGAYRSGALFTSRVAAVKALRAWMVGVVIALLVRSAIERHLTPLPFVIIAASFNGLWLVAWHALLGRLSPSAPPSPRLGPEPSSP